MTRVVLNLDSPDNDQLWPLVESTAYLFENVLGVDVVAAVDAHPDEKPAQAAQDRPRRDETRADRPGQESAAERRLRAYDDNQARHHARRATELGGHAGIAEGLAAIAHAILHGQEKP